jgi:5-formyltetrahydrofolate cyclo-ligase
MIAKADVEKMRAVAAPVEERAQRSRQICDAIVGDEAWQKARTVGLFAPQATEPDIELLWEQAGAKLSATRGSGISELDFLRVVDRGALLRDVESA